MTKYVLYEVHQYNLYSPAVAGIHSDTGQNLLKDGIVTKSPIQNLYCMQMIQSMRILLKLD